MHKTTQQSIKEAVEYYLGQSCSKVEIFRDPQVEGTYAIKIFFDDGNTEDMLIVGFDNADSIEEISEKLEECEFGSWPPTSGSLKFFV